MDFRGLIIICIGILFFIFRKPLSEQVIKQQKEYFKFNYSEKVIGRTEIVYIIMAIVAVIFGIILLFKIRFK